MNSLRSIALILGIGFNIILQAQDTSQVIINTGFDQEVLQKLDEIAHKRLAEVKNVDLHTSFFPFQGDVEYGMGKASYKGSEKSHGYMYRKLFLESFIEVDTSDFYLLVNPAFNFELGKDMQDTSGERLYVNTRGVSIHGKIGKNVTFFSRLYENQAFLPSYLDAFVSQTNVIPGQGRVKEFKKTGYDYAMASGVISFSPNKRLNLQLGNDKHHLGDGYRSLGLSSNAFNYPFVKISSWFGPFQYTNLFMGLQNLNVELQTVTGLTEPRFQRKIGTLHHLDWVVNKKLTIGVFEQMIWAKSNSKGKFDFNADAVSMINPIIFIRPLQYGFSDGNNVLVGFNAKLSWPKNTECYTQVVLDDPKSNKSGFQLGVKSWVVKNLIIRAEFNKVNVFTYAQGDSTRNFTHYNQALAHPSGSGFTEVSTSLSYYLKDFFVMLRLNYTEYDAFSGLDVLASDTSFVDFPTSPSVPTLLYQNVKLGYQINKTIGMQISLGIINRTYSTPVFSEEMQYVYLSFSTNIRRRTYDF